VIVLCGLKGLPRRGYRSQPRVSTRVSTLGTLPIEVRPHKALPRSALLEKHPVRRVGGAEGATGCQVNFASIVTQNESVQLRGSPLDNWTTSALLVDSICAFRARRCGGALPGLKPWAEFFSPFGACLRATGTNCWVILLLINYLCGRRSPSAMLVRGEGAKECRA
jgi:hypothetical protein